MITRRTPYRREDEEVSNVRIPLRNEKVTIIDQEDMNDVVPSTEPQKPQVPHMLPMHKGSQARYA